jgi:ADP-heptose:LPS heptosyltransferase
MYLVRKRQLGDVLWIEPIIRRLSSRYRKVIVHTKYNEVFKYNNYKNVVFKDKLFVIEKLLIFFDHFFGTSFFSINLDGAYEHDPRKHLLHAYQNISKLPVENLYPTIVLSKHEQEKCFFDNSKFAIIHFESFSSKNYRSVYGIEWEVISKYLNDLGYIVVQVGKHNQNIANTIFIKTSIRDLISLVKKSKLFIGIDSFPSHIAAIFKVPSLLFFGAINPDFRHFRDQFNGFFLQSDCELSGCYHSSKNGKEVSCYLVGDSGIPKCSIYKTSEIINNINNLIKKYNL